MKFTSPHFQNDATRAGAILPSIRKKTPAAATLSNQHSIVLEIGGTTPLIFRNPDPRHIFRIVERTLYEYTLT